MKKILLISLLAGGVQNSFAMGSCGGGAAQVAADDPVARHVPHHGADRAAEADGSGAARPEGVRLRIAGRGGGGVTA